MYLSILIEKQLKSRIRKRAAKTFAFSCSIGPLIGILLFLMILNHWINASSTFSCRDFRSLFGFKTFELNDCLMWFLFLKIIEIVEWPTPNSFARDEFDSPFSNLHIIAPFSSIVNALRRWDDIFFTVCTMKNTNDKRKTMRDLQASITHWDSKQKRATCRTSSGINEHYRRCRESCRSL